ncbi:hypothetical protein BACCOPRO_02634 [Phocaeicola coprophilus DSM 18228 = JCM 13818]|uniref:Uncharacterized protein n=1 Tax=Phocaeicola coprophilus DSM 18228 = JCM 13818 TaxID=547042 RepID=S0FBE4_9BACT|nr:hypothetical protein BACCOPRO_02634 [Phocaeicola coprophilus DSM 18228 = JCM 13818]
MPESPSVSDKKAKICKSFDSIPLKDLHISAFFIFLQNRFQEREGGV